MYLKLILSFIGILYALFSMKNLYEKSNYIFYFSYIVKFSFDIVILSLSISIICKTFIDTLQTLL
jgi:hypothetical protein